MQSSSRGSRSAEPSPAWSAAATAPPSLSPAWRARPGRQRRDAAGRDAPRAAGVPRAARPAQRWRPLNARHGPRDASAPCQTAPRRSASRLDGERHRCAPQRQPERQHDARGARPRRHHRRRHAERPRRSGGGQVGVALAEQEVALGQVHGRERREPGEEQRGRQCERTPAQHKTRRRRRQQQREGERCPHARIRRGRDVERGGRQ